MKTKYQKKSASVISYYLKAKQTLTLKNVKGFLIVSII